MIKYDYHDHSDFFEVENRDMETVIENYKSEKVKRVCVVEHYHNLRNKKDYEYVMEKINKANKHFKLNILHGIELNFTKSGASWKKYFDPKGIYLLGLHPEAFQDNKIPKRNELLKIFEKGLINPHVDIWVHPWRYFFEARFKLPTYEEQIEFINLIKKERKKGHKIHVEINAADCRHKRTLDEFYFLCVKHKIPLTFGSDVHHNHEEYKRRFKAARKYIKKHGFNVNHVIRK